MRQPLKQNSRREQVSVGKSISAPVGGWDAQNPLAAMPTDSAVLLRNWIPRPGFVELRRGYVPHVIGFAAAVESLIVWRGASPNKLFACSGAHIINVTAGGSAGSTVYASATNARWQHVNFANDAGAFAIACNGADTPRHFDGTTFSGLTITGSSGPITLDPTTLIDLMVFKRRLLFIENNSLHIWFLDVLAIQGAAQLLDLGPIFSKGGKLIGIGSWTQDGGAGPDDLAVFITDQGEVAVYQGTDPSDATNWALIGVYSIGLPLGRRALVKYGGDLVVLTTDGAVPLSQALSKDRGEDDEIAITAKIQNAFAAAARSFKNNFGWEAQLYQQSSLVIVNVPGGVTEQYVQNIQTGAWCEFTNIPAICWAICDDNPFFGASDGVYMWDAGSTDNGANIVADAQPAFNYFGQRGTLKQFTMLRPIMQVSRTIDPAVEMLVDFNTGIPTAVPTRIDDEGSIWGTSLWGTAIWEKGITTRYSWTSVTGLGYCASPIVRVSVGSDFGQDITVRLIGFDLIFQPGGQI